MLYWMDLQTMIPHIHTSHPHLASTNTPSLLASHDLGERETDRLRPSAHNQAPPIFPPRPPPLAASCTTVFPPRPPPLQHLVLPSFSVSRSSSSTFSSPLCTDAQEISSSHAVISALDPPFPVFQIPKANHPQEHSRMPALNGALQPRSFRLSVRHMQDLAVAIMWGARLRDSLSMWTSM
jgi:hypothetical protein